MLQIFIIILSRIFSHYAHYYAQNLLIIPNFTGEFLQLIFTFAIKNFKNIL